MVGRTFGDLEIFAPHWNVCERQNQAPEVFLHIYNPQDPKAAFDQSVLLALRREGRANAARERLAREIVTLMAKTMRAKVVHQHDGPWMICEYPGSFREALSYLLLPGQGFWSDERDRAEIPTGPRYRRGSRTWTRLDRSRSSRVPRRA